MTDKNWSGNLGEEAKESKKEWAVQMENKASVGSRETNDFVNDRNLVC